MATITRTDDRITPEAIIKGAPITASAAPPPTATPAEPYTPAVRYTAAVVRIGLGFVFLWAFVDKLFGLGFATEAKNAWVNGGSPTKGFLSFGTRGPLADFYQTFAGATLADALFMVGLLGIGLALVAGIGLRVAAAAGSSLLVLMWSAALLPENNPFLDDHLVYAGTLVLLALLGAGRTLGLGQVWARTPLVRSAPWLK
jgi:thiosulfate dehydrogenase [quinone] large subunit